MGTNKRYADYYDRQMSNKILERTAADGPLETLSGAELQLATTPCTKDPNPKQVEAWVRFGGVPVKVAAEACMWTSRAVAVRFKVADREYRCWVWVGAIEGPVDA